MSETVMLHTMSTTTTVRNSSSKRRGGCIFVYSRHFPAHRSSYACLFWGQILQLYVAAYQSPAIWKEAWKHLVGVISVQIIRDVESFVAKHPFADTEVMRFVVVTS